MPFADTHPYLAPIEDFAGEMPWAHIHLRQIAFTGGMLRTSLVCVLAALALIVLAYGLAGQKAYAAEDPPYLVKDIDTSSFGSDPSDLASVDGVIYFVTDNGVNGRELWKSDGTLTGTVLVKDIYPGPGYSGSPYPDGLTDVNGTLFFVADDGINGEELWKSDGTLTGTVMVKDIYPGGYGSSPSVFTNVNGTLFFRAGDNINGYELWKSDGTLTGTVLVKDIYPGASPSQFLRNWQQSVQLRPRKHPSQMSRRVLSARHCRSSPGMKYLEHIPIPCL